MGNNLATRTSLVSVVLLTASTSFFILGIQEGVGVLSGVMLSAIFVISSAWVLDNFIEAENSLFIKVFFFSTIIRFLLILIVFGILIGLTKIDEIYFTVSFIISYLCQSVMEMFFINQILQKSGNQRQ